MKLLLDNSALKEFFQNDESYAYQFAKLIRRLNKSYNVEFFVFDRCVLNFCSNSNVGNNNDEEKKKEELEKSTKKIKN